jgi:hypothetical protein
MQRLITGWSAASEQFSCRGYSSRCSWPYSPTQTTSAQPSSSISSHPAQQAASNSRVAAPRAGSGGLVHSVEQLLHQLKHGVGKDIWEVGDPYPVQPRLISVLAGPKPHSMTRTVAVAARRLL